MAGIGSRRVLIRNVVWRRNTNKYFSHYPFIRFGTVKTNDIQPSNDKNAIFEVHYDSHILTSL